MNGFLLAVSSILLWVVVLFNLLITFQLIRLIAPDVWERNSPKLRKGQRAPAFTAETLEGTKVTLASFRGQSFLLIFVSTQCNACMERLPEIQAICPVASHANVQIALVCDADRHQGKMLANKFRLKIPMWVAPKSENSIWRDYKANGTPYYCLVDEQLRIQTTGFFDSEWEALTQMWKINATI